MDKQPHIDQPLTQHDLDRICDPLPWLGLWRRFDSVASTQEVAAGLAATHPEGLLVLADEQTAGRGRQGRSWDSPRGAGLWLSLVLSPARPREEWPLLTSMGALALRDAVRLIADLGTGLKWPNDLYCRGRKMAGVLADAGGAVEAPGRVILGLGLNLTQRKADFPPALRGSATSLALEWSEPVDRRRILQAVLERFTHRLERFEAEGPAGQRADLEEASLLLGRRVGIGPEGETGLAGEAQWTGRVVELGPLGELILEPDDASGKPGRGRTRRSVASGMVVWTDPPIVGG